MIFLRLSFVGSNNVYNGTREKPTSCYVGNDRVIYTIEQENISRLNININIFALTPH